MCEHVHDWIPFLPRAEGYFSKRNENPANATLEVNWYMGCVLSCAHPPCETFLFIPDAPSLCAVECEFVTNVKAAVAA